MFNGHNLKDKYNYNADSKRYNADTFIEQRLLELCSVSERKIKIYFDWQSDKNEYVKRTSTIVYDFQHYSLHDQTHSVSILEAIEKFLGNERVVLLGIGDLWLLLQAAYSHDIGMSIKYDELKELWNDDHFLKYLESELNNPESNSKDSVLYYKQMNNLIFKLEQMKDLSKEKEKIFQFTKSWPLEVQKHIKIIIGEYIRKRHAERSKDYIQRYAKCLNTHSEKRLFTLLGQVSYAHMMDFSYILSELPYETDGFGNEKMHPKFVAALLRLGDLLDLDNNRFDLYTLEHFGELPQVSQAHLHKHQAISQLCVTDRKIEVTGETDNSEVAHLLQMWFDNIESEVGDITSNWNIIAPEKLGGCTFRNCNLEVYLCGEKYKETGEEEFRLDKLKLIKLLMGKNIYHDEMQCFREYIQNALDATKMKIWMDIQSGELDYILKNNNREKDEIMPFDLTTEYFDRYGIDLEIGIISNGSDGRSNDELSQKDLIDEQSMREARVRFVVRDRGIGIEDECIEVISNIGNGWRGRTRYASQITEMPSWLKPTGGFGIGMQSGFMLTDRITVITKCEGEKATKLILDSPNYRGGITKQSYKKKDLCGTDIIFEVPVVKLYQISTIKDELKEYHKPIKDDSMKLQSYFDYERLERLLAEVLEGYIAKVFPNNLVPITIKSKGRELLKTGYLQTDLGFLKNNNEMGSQIWTYVSENIVEFWDKKDQIFMRVNANGTGKTQFCFKNVIVQNNKDDFKEMNVSGLDILIDFMGYRAVESLTIDRNRFLETFDIAKHFLKCIHMFVENDIGRPSYGIATAALIDGISYGYREVVEEIVSKPQCEEMIAYVLINTSPGQYILKEKNIKLLKIYELLSDKEKYENKDKGKEISRPKFFISGNINEKRLEGADLPPLYELHEEDGKTGIDNSVIPKNEYMFRKFILGHLKAGTPVFPAKEVYTEGSNYSARKIIDIGVLISGFSKGLGYHFRLSSNENEIITMYYPFPDTVKEEGDVYLEILKENTLFCVAPPSFDKDFEKLYVKEVPFVLDDSLYDKNKIMLPMTNQHRVLLDSLKKEKGKKYLLSEFLEDVKQGDSFHGCVDWVIQFSKSTDFITREAIEQLYIDFCKKIYLYAERMYPENGYV